LEILREKAELYKSNIYTNLNNNDTYNNQNLNNCIGTHLEIELAKSREKDKKSSSKSTENISNNKIVIPYIHDKKENIFKKKENQNSANTLDHSDNNFFNQSDRRKLMLTNDLSLYENISELYNNNIDRNKKKTSYVNKDFDIKNLNNLSFGNIDEENIKNNFDSNKIRNERDIYDDDKNEKIKEKELLTNNLINIDNDAKNKMNRNNSSQELKVICKKFDRRSVPEVNKKIISDINLKLLESSNNKARNGKFNKESKIYKQHVKDNLDQENYLKDMEVKNKEYEKNKEIKQDFIFEVIDEIYLDEKSKISKDNRNNNILPEICHKTEREDIKLKRSKTSTFQKKKKINLRSFDYEDKINAENSQIEITFSESDLNEIEENVSSENNKKNKDFVKRYSSYKESLEERNRVNPIAITKEKKNSQSIIDKI